MASVLFQRRTRNGERGTKEEGSGERDKEEGVRVDPTLMDAI
jgi:hypothetical protein